MTTPLVAVGNYEFTAQSHAGRTISGPISFSVGSAMAVDVIPWWKHAYCPPELVESIGMEAGSGILSKPIIDVSGRFCKLVTDVFSAGLGQFGEWILPVRGISTDGAIRFRVKMKPSAVEFVRDQEANARAKVHRFLFTSVTSLGPCKLITQYLQLQSGGPYVNISYAVSHAPRVSRVLQPNFAVPVRLAREIVKPGNQSADVSVPNFLYQIVYYMTDSADSTVLSGREIVTSALLNSAGLQRSYTTRQSLILDRYQSVGASRSFAKSPLHTMTFSNLEKGENIVNVGQSARFAVTLRASPKERILHIYAFISRQIRDIDVVDDDVVGHFAHF